MVPYADEPAAVAPLQPPACTGDQQARFRFTGPFRGAQVTWCCELVTLRCESERTGVREQQQFLDITPTPRQQVYDIRIGLALDTIDEAAVHGSIIMVRKYRRLALGRHSYGAVHRY